MTKAIRIFETGGPEVMQLVDAEAPAPGPAKPASGNMPSG